MVCLQDVFYVQVNDILTLGVELDPQFSDVLLSLRQLDFELLVEQRFVLLLPLLVLHDEEEGEARIIDGVVPVKEWAQRLSDDGVH